MESDKAKRRAKQLGMQARYNSSMIDGLRQQLFERRAQSEELSVQLNRLESEIKETRVYRGSVLPLAEATQLQFLYLEHLENKQNKLQAEHSDSNEIEAMLVEELKFTSAQTELFENKAEHYRQLYVRQISKRQS